MGRHRRGDINPPPLAPPQSPLLLLRRMTTKQKEQMGLKSILEKDFFFNGARIGIVAKPSAEFVSAVLGTWLSGGVSVPLALSYPEAKLLHVMNDSDIFVLLSTQDHHELMENVAIKSSAHFSLIPTVTSISSKGNTNDHAEDGLSDNLTNMLENIEASRLAEGDNAALILYTSGTTGKPKGLVHTHNGLISQVQILTEAWEYTCYDQFLHCLPLHHMHGLFNALLAPLYAGSVATWCVCHATWRMPDKQSCASQHYAAKIRRITRKSTSPSRSNSCPNLVWEGCGRDGVNHIQKMEVKLMMLLLRSQEFQQCILDCSKAMEQWTLIFKFLLLLLHISCISCFFSRRMCGSAALPYPVLKQWEEVTSPRLLERYGMTEVSRIPVFVMALSNPLHGTRKAGTVGKPLPRVEVQMLTL